MDAECPLPFSVARHTAPILRRVWLVHAFPTRYFKITLNIVLTSTPKSFQLFTIETLYKFLLLPYEVSRLSWYDSPGNSYNQRRKHANVKITFLQAVCHNSDMLRSILIIFRELHQ